MSTFTVNNLSITPHGKDNLVSISVSLEGERLVSFQAQVLVPKSFTNLVDIQDYLAHRAIHGLEVLTKSDPTDAQSSQSRSAYE